MTNIPSNETSQTVVAIWGIQNTAHSKLHSHIKVMLVNQIHELFSTLITTSNKDNFILPQYFTIYLISINAFGNLGFYTGHLKMLKKMLVCETSRRDVAQNQGTMRK
jgi:hypothetical protein